MKAILLRKLRSKYRIIQTRDGDYWVQKKSVYMKNRWNLTHGYYQKLADARNHMHALIRNESEYIQFKHNHKIIIRA